MTKLLGDCPRFYYPVGEYMEKPCHDGCVVELSVGCHDPMARYVGRIFNENGGLVM